MENKKTPAETPQPLSPDHPLYAEFVAHFAEEARRDAATEGDTESVLPLSHEETLAGTPLPADSTPISPELLEKFRVLHAEHTGAPRRQPADHPPLSPDLIDEFRIFHGENNVPPHDAWDAQRPEPKGQGRFRRYER